MRSMVSTLAVGAFLALIGASPALAASHEFSGQIGKVDAVAKSLMVKANGMSTKEMTFEVSPDAKITMGGKALELRTLKSGEQVRVTYVDDGTAHKAERIEVKLPKTAAAKPPVRPKSQ